MMQIGKVNGSGNTVQAVKDTVSTARTDTDSVSKEIQSRITNAQNKRQEIASNQRMSEEEKSSERQKIQQEISDLKRQLRQRQLEEQKEQKEADKAARKQEEQEKQARAEVIREQQNGSAEGSKEQRDSRAAKAANGGSQESQAADSRDKRAEEVKADSKPDEESRKTQREDMQKGISKGAAVEQFRVLRKANQQIAAKAKVQEAEIKQDEARGADVEKKVKAQQAETEKKARQVEMVQDFMFEDNSAKEIKADNQAAVGLKGRGLYTNRGTMFGNLFPADKMDVQQ